jgi:hypothetical protein
MTVGEACPETSALPVRMGYVTELHWYKNLHTLPIIHSRLGGASHGWAKAKFGRFLYMS